MTTAQSPVRYIDAVTERYARLGYETYRWYAADTAPTFTPLAKPLSQARLGVLTTSGCYRAGQVAFHYRDDSSLRHIPRDTPTEQLRFAHLTENYLVDARQDPECLVPLGAQRTLQAEGVFGGLADDIVSCMGAIYSQRRVREETEPRLEQVFREQQVDGVLLIPM